MTKDSERNGAHWPTEFAALITDELSLESYQSRVAAQYVYGVRSPTTRQVISQPSIMVEPPKGLSERHWIFGRNDQRTAAFLEKSGGRGHRIDRRHNCPTACQVWAYLRREVRTCADATLQHELDVRSREKRWELRV